MYIVCVDGKLILNVSVQTGIKCSLGNSLCRWLLGIIKCICANWKATCAFELVET